MKLYQSNYLTIKLKNDMFLQSWSGENITETIFKYELTEFIKLFLELKPKQLLWDNRKFNLLIPEALNEWIEKEIMIPQYQNGLKKLAFIVTPDVIIQQTVIKSVESFKPYNKPEFFLSEVEALCYLLEQASETLLEDVITDLSIEHLDNNDYELKLQINNENLEDTVVALNEITKFQEYRNLYQDVFNSLTVKEKIIIRQIVYGSTAKEIAKILFIQSQTVDTHRKNLKRKINYKNTFELVYFARAFGIISF